MSAGIYQRANMCEAGLRLRSLASGMVLVLVVVTCLFVTRSQYSPGVWQLEESQFVCLVLGALAAALLPLIALGCAFQFEISLAEPGTGPQQPTPLNSATGLDWVLLLAATGSFLANLYALTLQYRFPFMWDSLSNVVTGSCCVVMAWAWWWAGLRRVRVAQLNRAAARRAHSELAADRDNKPLPRDRADTADTGEERLATDSPTETGIISSVSPLPPDTTDTTDIPASLIGEDDRPPVEDDAEEPAYKESLQQMVQQLSEVRKSSESGTRTEDRSESASVWNPRISLGEAARQSFFQPDEFAPTHVQAEAGHRETADDGRERVAGEASVRFEPGQIELVDHIVFDPPLRGTPQVELSTGSQGLATARVCSAVPYGLRVGLHLNAPTANPCEVTYRYEARVPPHRHQ